MSEIIRIDWLKAHAEKSAAEGKTLDACPCKDDPRRSEIWKSFYYSALEEDQKAA